MTGELRYCELTKYPKIFDGSYWGNFRHNPNNLTDGQRTIIENRNKFVQDYDIKKRLDKPPQYVYIHFDRNHPNLREKHIVLDHVECYLNKGGDYVIISSPYDKTQDEKYESLGWIKVEPLYSIDNKAITYLKIVKSRRRKI